MNNTVIPIRLVASNGLIHQNVVTVRLLALCPMLAVSTSVAAATTLGLLTTLVMALSGLSVATLRNVIPSTIRLPVFLVLIATMVAIADIITEAVAPAMHRQLGIFLPLIVTNCAVLARLELFASKHPPLAATVDGLASGGGLSAALILLALGRELLGTGGIEHLLDIPFYNGIPIAHLPVGGFILFGLMLAVLKILKIGRQ